MNPAEYDIMAESGHAATQVRLGLMYLYGKGCKRDWRLGMEWLRRAACQGNMEAIYQLACQVQHGNGAAPNPAEAVRLFKLAAGCGHAKAMRRLGLCYLRGQGIAKNSEKGLAWLLSAARRGDKLALNDLTRLDSITPPLQSHADK